MENIREHKNYQCGSRLRKLLNSAAEPPIQNKKRRAEEPRHRTYDDVRIAGDRAMQLIALQRPSSPSQSAACPQALHSHRISINYECRFSSAIQFRKCSIFRRFAGLRVSGSQIIYEKLPILTVRQISGVFQN